MADGKGGSVVNDSNGYDEPPRTGQSTNRMATDCAEQAKQNDNRGARSVSFTTGLKDGRDV